MVSQCIARAEEWLQNAVTWSPDQISALARLAPSLLALLPRASTWFVGIGGPPGTGKSTLAGLLRHLWNERADAPPMIVLSIDDYYLTKEERARLAARVHPLLGRRGPPGTHDHALLFEHIEQLLSGKAERLALPRFDKGRDDRCVDHHEIDTGGQPAAVLLEGWFVGTPPQPQSALDTAVNSFEAQQDPDGRWRGHVNQALASFDDFFTEHGMARWHLAPPGWEEVLDWRWKQEQEMELQRRMLRDLAAVAAFLEPFERITRFQLEHEAAWADVVLKLDTEHRPRLESRT